MMLYMASNKIPDMYFAFNQCSRFTHNNKESHDTYINRICQYVQVNKDKGIVLNQSKIIVVDFMLMQIFGNAGT